MRGVRFVYLLFLGSPLIAELIFQLTPLLPITLSSSRPIQSKELLFNSPQESPKKTGDQAVLSTPLHAPSRVRFVDDAEIICNGKKCWWSPAESELQVLAGPTPESSPAAKEANLNSSITDSE